MVDYSKFDFIEDSDEELSAPSTTMRCSAPAPAQGNADFPTISSVLSGGDQSQGSVAFLRWQEAKAHPSNPQEEHFFQLQDELHRKLAAICCVGQTLGDKGSDARMKKAKQLIDDTIFTKELRLYATKWNNPFGEPDADPLDQCTWTMSAMMRGTEFKEDSCFSDILGNEFEIAKKNHDEEAQIFDKAMQDAQKSMSFNMESARSCCSCGKDPAPHMCSGCSVACYCSEACQRRHWKSHKEICNKLKNAEAELHALKDMDALLRSPIISLNDKRRAFCLWKQVRTSIDIKGKQGKQDKKHQNSSVTIGRFSYSFALNYSGNVTWKQVLKTKGLTTCRLQVPYSEFKEAGFDADAPWLSDVDACRC